jgi:hypothetical protein
MVNCGVDRARGHDKGSGGSGIGRIRRGMDDRGIRFVGDNTTIRGADGMGGGGNEWMDSIILSMCYGDGRGRSRWWRLISS